MPRARVGRDEYGHEVLRANFDAQLRPLGVTVLQVTNHVIDVVDADSATGIVSCRAEIEMGDGSCRRSSTTTRTTRRDGHWKFARRRHLLIYGADLLQRPIGLPLAHSPARATGKGELPEQLPTWRAFYGEDSWSGSSGVHCTPLMFGVSTQRLMPSRPTPLVFAASRSLGGRSWFRQRLRPLRVCPSRRLTRPSTDAAGGFSRSSV